MKRITQPSTWAAFAVLIQMAKPFVPAVWHPVVDAASAGAASLGVALNEKGAAK